MSEPIDDLESEKHSGKEDRHFITALSRGLQVLSCFQDAKASLGNQELAARTGFPKSTVSRLTYTLSKMGYLEVLENPVRYSLGPATIALGASALNKLDIGRIASQPMRDLADFAKGSVSLGMRDRLSIVYLENQRGQATFTLNVEAGWRVPIATTAIGRAYLASCDAMEQEFIQNALREDDPSAWQKVRRSIESSCGEYQRYGYCTSLGDWQPEVHSIATSISRGPGKSPMVINCGGPAFVLTSEFLRESVAPKLLATAKTIEASAGWYLASR